MSTYDPNQQDICSSPTSSSEEFELEEGVDDLKDGDYREKPKPQQQRKRRRIVTREKVEKKRSRKRRPRLSSSSPSSSTTQLQDPVLTFKLLQERKGSAKRKPTYCWQPDLSCFVFNVGLRMDTNTHSRPHLIPM